VRIATRPSEPALKAILDPRRVLRWVFTGRLCLASAIFIAAVGNWTKVDADQTLVASIAFAVTTAVTVMSAGYVEIYRHRPGPGFLYLQAAFDTLLVTAVVHVTNGDSSPFSALYILVIATATLTVPESGGLLIAALGLVLYLADVLFFFRAPGTLIEPTVWVQLLIFALVALCVRYLSAGLRASGEGTDQLLATLEQTRLQAEDILHNIRSGVITVDGTGHLLYANPISASLLGFDIDERLGRPILEAIGAVAPELGQALRQAAEQKIRTTRGEGFVSTASKRFPIGVTTTYTERDDSGAGRTATAIFQDISDSKRLDVLRLRAERLEGIAELSASLAHEIKNPLASIRSAVEQISRMPTTSDDQKTLSVLVMRESDRLSRLLSEFLDFARVRVARTDHVDLGTIACTAASLAASHPDKDETVTVVCVPPAGVNLEIEGDEDMLHRAIFNLALNAVQASPPDSEVCIELTHGTFDPMPLGLPFEGEAVSLRVTDAGPGIPNEIRDRMFDPFFTTKAGGSGLGLAVVHRAIEAHRGMVFVDNTPRGTRFTVILPRHKQTMQQITMRTPS
jgi:two-component system sensor histidine kinase PilS (NtrC family)